MTGIIASNPLHTLRSGSDLAVWAEVWLRKDPTTPQLATEALKASKWLESRIRTILQKSFQSLKQAVYVCQLVRVFLLRPLVLDLVDQDNTPHGTFNQTISPTQSTSPSNSKPKSNQSPIGMPHAAISPR